MNNHSQQFSFDHLLSKMVILRVHMLEMSIEDLQSRLLGQQWLVYSAQSYLCCFLHTQMKMCTPLLAVRFTIH